MQLGSFRLKNPWILAPMAGVSEMPYRVLALEMGAGAAPTELVSAKGLLFGQDRTSRYLTHDAREHPFWVQLFGGEPAAMAQGARRAVELGAQIIDVNMGCPVKKVTRNGAGSALLKDPPRAAAIVRAIADATSVPVTAKVRAGWDAESINVLDMVKRLADAGCVAVSLHARTREQGYSGRADWTLIARLCAESPIPIIGNGDVTCVESAHRMLATTGCAAVMIGRAALGNPWIFRQLSGGPMGVSPAERFEVIARHFAAHRAFVGDDLRAVRRFRQHLAWYSHGLAKAALFRQNAYAVDDVNHLMELCRHYFTGAAFEASQEQVPIDLRTALG